MNIFRLKSMITHMGGSIACALLILVTGCSKAPEQAHDTDLSAATDLFNASPIQTGRMAPDMSLVLANIDGYEITQGELMNEVNMLAGRMRGRVPPERLAQMQDEIMQGAMENLIIKQLLLNEVDKRDIQITEAEIEETIGVYRQQIPPGSTLEEQLAQINMLESDFRENIKREMRVNKLLESKVAEMEQPSDADIQAFHEEHKDDYFAMPESAKASHILINARPTDDPATRAEARAKAEAIRQQLLDGADFAELAGAESDCPSSQQGGDLGTFVRGQMVPPFEAAAFSQEIGEIGEIVETDFGFHVIQVAERHAPRTQPLEESKDQIAQFLVGQSREKVLRAYIDELREGANIEIVGQP